MENKDYSSINELPTDILKIIILYYDIIDKIYIGKLACINKNFIIWLII